MAMQYLRRYGGTVNGCWFGTTMVAGLPFRLADGRTREGVSRAKVLKGIGNAIVPAVAAEFMMAYMETVDA